MVQHSSGVAHLGLAKGQMPTDPPGFQGQGSRTTKALGTAIWGPCNHAGTFVTSQAWIVCEGHVTRVQNNWSHFDHPNNQGAATWGMSPRTDTAPTGRPTFASTTHLLSSAMVQPCNRWQLWDNSVPNCLCLSVLKREELSFLRILTKSPARCYGKISTLATGRFGSTSGSAINGWLTSSQFHNLSDLWFLNL